MRAGQRGRAGGGRCGSRLRPDVWGWGRRGGVSGGASRREVGGRGASGACQPGAQVAWGCPGCPPVGPPGRRAALPSCRAGGGAGELCPLAGVGARKGLQLRSVEACQSVWGDEAAPPGGGGGGARLGKGLAR